LLCDKGCFPTPFIATPKTQNHHGITGGTIRDNLPLLNILPFGVCTVTRYPCIPVMPIWDDYPKTPWYVEGFQPLLLSSCAGCQLGGTIRIYTSYFDALAAMRTVSKSWKDKLLDALDDATGSILLSPVAPVLKMCGLDGVVKNVGEFGRGFVAGVAKGLWGTLEGLYNMVAHPLDTLGGMATMAGVAVVGYANPLPGISPEQRLQKFDDFFGTNLALVNEGIKQSLSEAGGKFMHGTSAERGEVAGQAVEFVAEFFVGTKGAGAAMKAVKGGSMGGKAAKVAEVADKAADITKAAGGKVKQWTLDKLPKSTKGIFGKKRPKLPANATNKQKGNWGEKVSHDNKVNNPALKEKGYDLERIGNDPPKGLDDPIRHGIDGIYENKTSPPKYVIDEAKYGSSPLGGHTKVFIAYGNKR
jgi:hypothetical protein